MLKFPYIFSCYMNYTLLLIASIFLSVDCKEIYSKKKIY